MAPTLKVLQVKDYTIPLFGNKRPAPYGNLLVTDGKQMAWCKIRDEEGFPYRQYVVFRRKRFRVKNTGSLWTPKYEVGEEM